MPNEVVKFCEFWNKLRDIYKETYPEAYEKYGFPDGETFLAIDYMTSEGKSNIKNAVNAGFVSPDIYENIKNIIRSGKLDDKIAPDDKQQILDDAWGETFTDIRQEWYAYSYSKADNHYSVMGEAEKFVNEVKAVKRKQIMLEMEQRKLEEAAKEAARKLEEQKKAEEEAENKRQAEFEKKFREEDEEEKRIADERHEEQKELNYLKDDFAQFANMSNFHKKAINYASYEQEVEEREKKRAKREAEKLEEERNWSEEYREEVKHRREIYRQNIEKEKRQKEEQEARKKREKQEEQLKKAEEEAAKREKLKNDLKEWVSALSESLPEIEEKMNSEKERYKQHPETVLEWGKSLAKIYVEMSGLRQYKYFSTWMKKDVDELEIAAGKMPTKEAQDEFLTLIDQGNLYMKKYDAIWNQIDREKKELPTYIRDFVEGESQDLFQEKRSSEYKENKAKERRERWEKVVDQHKEATGEKQRKQEAEKKRLEEEAKKKRLEEEAAERETLKKDLKDLIAASDTTLPRIKEEIKNLQMQYDKQPNDLVEWAKSMAKTRAAMLGFRDHMRFGRWEYSEQDKLKAAYKNIPTQEEKDEFKSLLDQGIKCTDESQSLWDQIENVIKKQPDYVRNFVESDSKHIADDAFDKSQEDSDSRKKRAARRKEIFKEFNAQHKKDILQQKKAEQKRLEEAAAEKKRLEEEAAAEKKRQEEAAAEKKHLEEEAAKKKRLEEEAAAEKKRLEEEAEKKRLEEAAEKKRLEEEAEKKRLEEAAAEKKRQEEAAAEKKRLDEEEAEKQARLQREADTRKDIFSAYDAVKDTKNRNFLKSHTKFADMMSAMREYQEAFSEVGVNNLLADDAKKRIADRAYEACITYLKSHLDTGKNGSSLDGQGTPEGRLRKQAVVQILEKMKELPEFKEKPEFQDEVDLQAEAKDEKPQKKENKRERINFDQLKNSLAAKSKIDRQRPYAELENKKAQKNEMGPKK